jgi:hypothetical protein
MKSLFNTTMLAIIIAATIISCSKENVFQENKLSNESTIKNNGTNFGKSDTAYVSGVKLDTPYVPSSFHKGGDTPYLGHKLLDTPYVNGSAHRNIDTPYVATKLLDTPYLKR